MPRLQRHNSPRQQIQRQLSSALKQPLPPGYRTQQQQPAWWRPQHGQLPHLQSSGTAAAPSTAASTKASASSPSSQEADTPSNLKRRIRAFEPAGACSYLAWTTFLLAPAGAPKLRSQADASRAGGHLATFNRMGPLAMCPGKSLDSRSPLATCPSRSLRNRTHVAMVSSSLSRTEVVALVDSTENLNHTWNKCWKRSITMQFLGWQLLTLTLDHRKSYDGIINWLIGICIKKNVDTLVNCFLGQYAHNPILHSEETFQRVDYRGAHRHNPSRLQWRAHIQVPRCLYHPQWGDLLCSQQRETHNSYIDMKTHRTVDINYNIETVKKNKKTIVLVKTLIWRCLMYGMKEFLYLLVLHLLDTNLQPGVGELSYIPAGQSDAQRYWASIVSIVNSLKVFIILNNIQSQTFNINRGDKILFFQLIIVLVLTLIKKRDKLHHLIKWWATKWPK